MRVVTCSGIIAAVLIYAIFDAGASIIIDSSCVSPPLECPNSNITFWLYTRDTQDNPHQLDVARPETITGAKFVEGAPFIVLIHGYTGDRDYAPNPEIRPAYFQHGEYNVISPDYNPLARESCYFTAAMNVPLVGRCTAQVMDELISKRGVPLESFHVVGFSLGAQVSGAIANWLTAGKLERITGLDPAMPLFVTTDLSRKLDKTDAKFVDIIHTDATKKGKLEATGHVDFYVNGGMSQPGCESHENMSKPSSFLQKLKQRLLNTWNHRHFWKSHKDESMASIEEDTTPFKDQCSAKGSDVPDCDMGEKMSRSSCNHWRAPVYFGESINSEVGFYGKKCSSWLQYMVGWCHVDNATEEVIMGEYTPNTAQGLFFVETNREAPFARGRWTGSSSRQGAGNNTSEGQETSSPEQQYVEIMEMNY